MARDRYDELHVFVAESGVSPAAGEGLFASCPILTGQLICLFNGVRVNECSGVYYINLEHSVSVIKWCFLLDLDIKGEERHSQAGLGWMVRLQTYFRWLLPCANQYGLLQWLTSNGHGLNILLFHFQTVRSTSTYPSTRRPSRTTLQPSVTRRVIHLTRKTPSLSNSIIRGEETKVTP